MATPNYEVNYDDERFQQVADDKQQAMTELEQTYDGMISNSDSYYDKLIENAENWKNEQTALQNQQTEHTINQINQQKDQANKDYVKEQSGAYVDWQKQSNQYGTEAEKMAASGLTNTGFSESSQVSMYNTYQNRVATARESYNQAVLNYDNAIKDAQLQNSSILAEIAYNSLQQQLELSLQGFQYKNNLILEQANKKTELNNTYYNRYLDVLNQINTENALAEDVRQYEQTQIWETEQAELNRQHQFTLQELDNNFKAQQAELDRQFQAAQAELERKHDKEMLAAQTKAEKELLDKKHKQALEQLEKQKQNDLAKIEKEYELAKKSAVVAGNSSNSSNTVSVKGLDTLSSTPKGSTNKMDLGLGPRTDDYLAKLAAAGLITITKGSDGKVYYYNKKGVTSQNVDALLKLAGY